MANNAHSGLVETEYVGTYRVRCSACEMHQSAAHAYCGFCGVKFARGDE